jgi:CDP-diacylglycerol--glycerol-3-phosphate 3-phosphatidyltransferase
MNLPNILSFSRILLLIPIIFLFEFELYLFSVGIFIIASLTDYLDGYFARRNNTSTESGALLDLLADKLFISTLLVWITFNIDNIFILISSILIISREISISYLRLFIFSQKGEIGDLKSDFSGKLKTTFQMIGLGFIFITPITPNFIFDLSIALISFSAIISWYSFIKYLNKWIV